MFHQCSLRSVQRIIPALTPVFFDFMFLMQTTGGHRTLQSNPLFKSAQDTLPTIKILYFLLKENITWICLHTLPSWSYTQLKWIINQPNDEHGFQRFDKKYKKMNEPTHHFSQHSRKRTTEARNWKSFCVFWLSSDKSMKVEASAP